MEYNYYVVTMYVSGSQVTVGLSQTLYSVGEENGSQTVCAILSGMTQRSVTVTLSTVQGTAQGEWNTEIKVLSKFIHYIFQLTDTDFDSTTVELEFQPESTTACVAISISEDLRLENNEMFSVELNTTDQAVVLNPRMALVSIIDNDSKLQTLASRM